MVGQKGPFLKVCNSHNDHRPTHMKQAEEYNSLLFLSCRSKAGMHLKNRFEHSLSEIFEYLCVLLYTMFHNATTPVINYELKNCCLN